MKTLKITDLPSVQSNSVIGITMQPTISMGQTLAQRGQCFHERRSTILASRLRYLALYCPQNVSYKYADRSDVPMDLGLRRRVYAIVEIGDSFRPTSELIAAYNDLFFSDDAHATQRASERWPHAVNIVRVYKLVPAISIDQVWNTKRPSWARDLFRCQEVEVSRFKDVELIDMGTPEGVARLVADRVPDGPDLADLRESATRNGCTIEEARRSDVLYALMSPLRRGELKIGIGQSADGCEARRVEARRWLGGSADFVGKFSAVGYAASLESSVHQRLKALGKHAGGEWFRINEHELETIVAQTQLPWVQRNR